MLLWVFPTGTTTSWSSRTASRAVASAGPGGFGQVKEVPQSPSYPRQLMLGIYEFGGARAEDAYPKELVVDHVRGCRPRDRR